MQESPTVHRDYCSAEAFTIDCLDWNAYSLDGVGMGSRVSTILYILLLVVVVVAVDFLFFKNHFWERLTANLGIVMVFAAFYFRFLKRP
jgi:hypothetical protein